MNPAITGMQVSTFYGLLKILATMAGGSHVVAEALLQVRMQRGQLRCCHLLTAISCCFAAGARTGTLC